MSTVEQLKSKLKFVDCILHELEGTQNALVSVLTKNN